MRLIRIVVALALAGIAACASSGDSNSCTYMTKPALHDVDPKEVTFAVASPQFPVHRSPYLILWNVADRPHLSIALNKLSDQSPIPFNESGARCGQAEIRFFDLEIGFNDWSEHWLIAQERRGFSAAVLFPGLDPPERYNIVGFAFLPGNFDVASIRCGCMAR